jgi:hypothetical protein
MHFFDPFSHENYENAASLKKTFDFGMEREKIAKIINSQRTFNALHICTLRKDFLGKGNFLIDTALTKEERSRT